MSRLRRLTSLFLKLLIGLLFCLSAGAKLLAIDDFELYIYSYGFFSLHWSFLLARLCIGFEFFIGALTLVEWFHRLTFVSTMGLLIVFSLFLCYAMLVGRDDSCRCFGQFVELAPAWSLLKNSVLILMVLAYRRVESKRDTCGILGRGGADAKRKGIVGVVGGLVVMTLPFVFSVPDNWIFGPSQEPYNQEAFREAMGEEGALRKLGAREGRHLVAFVTPKCPYCQLARRKIDSMAERHSFAEGSVLYVQPADISDRLFLDITCVDGICSRPLILLVDADSVVATYHLRNIDERKVSEFLSKDCFYK